MFIIVLCLTLNMLIHFYLNIYNYCCYYMTFSYALLKWRLKLLTIVSGRLLQNLRPQKGASLASPNRTRTTPTAGEQSSLGKCCYKYKIKTLQLAVYFVLHNWDQLEVPYKGYPLNTCNKMPNVSLQWYLRWWISLCTLSLKSIQWKHRDA